MILMINTVIFLPKKVFILNIFEILYGSKSDIDKVL